MRSDVAWRMEIGKWMDMFWIYFKVRVKRITDILYMSTGKNRGPKNEIIIARIFNPFKIVAGRAI